MKKIIFPFFNKKRHSVLLKKWQFRLAIVLYIIAIIIIPLVIFFDYMSSYEQQCYYSVGSNFKYGSPEYKFAFQECKIGAYEAILSAVGMSIISTLLFHYFIQLVFFKVVVDYIALGLTSIKKTGNNRESQNKEELKRHFEHKEEMEIKGVRYDKNFIIRIFQGRLNRLDYLFFILAVIFSSGFLGAILLILASKARETEVIFLLNFFLGVLILYSFIAVYFIISAHIRRFHDLNKSGFWMLLIFIPFFGIGVILYLIFARGTDGINKYGTVNRKKNFFRRVLNLR